MIQFVIEFLIAGIGYLFFIIFGFYTGELILFLLTFGRKKINFKYHFTTKDHGNKSYVFTEFTAWLGIIFWIALISLY